MTTKFAALLFLLAPLAAQAADRAASLVPYPLPLHLEVRTTDAKLGLTCWSDWKDPKGIGIVVASATGRTHQFLGLPPLLIPEAVLVCGSLAGGLSFEVKFAGLPFDLHIQAAGLVFGELAVSPMRIVESGQANGIKPPVDADK